MEDIAGLYVRFLNLNESEQLIYRSGNWQNTESVTSEDNDHYSKSEVIGSIWWLLTDCFLSNDRNKTFWQDFVAISAIYAAYPENIQSSVIMALNSLALLEYCLL